MTLQDNLRMQVKALKVYNDITYRAIADQINMNDKSFYSWLRGHYSLGAEKTKLLIKVLNDRKDGKTA